MLMEPLTTAADLTCGRNGNPECLPLERWAWWAGSLNTRIDDDSWKSAITGALGNIPVNIEGAMLSLGNGIWSLTGKAVGMAAGIDVFDKAGRQVDALLAGLSGLFGDNRVAVAAIFLFVMISGLVAVYRNAGHGVLLKRILAAAIGITLFMFGTGQATASMSRAETDPAPGSPHWVAQKVNSFANLAGGGVLDAQVNGTASSSDTSMRNAKASGLTDCSRYLAQLHKDAANGAKVSLSAGRSKATLDMTVFRDETSRMWEQTGLVMWATAQYGAPGNTMQVRDNTRNPRWQNMTRAYCRVLENRAGVSAAEQASLTNRAAGGALGTPQTVERGAAYHGGILYSADNDSDQSASAMEDRLSSIWEVCRVTRDADGKVHYGVSDGWGWVDWMAGPNRGIDGKAGKMAENCRAALTGQATVDGKKQDFFATAEIEKKKQDKIEEFWKAQQSTALNGTGTPMVNVGDLADRSLANEGTGDYMKVVGKFDIPESPAVRKTAADWSQTESASKKSEADKRSVQQATDAAMSTVDAMHGSAGFADVGGTLLFIAAAISCLIIFGGLAAVIVVSKLAMSLLAMGVYIAALLWAVTPDRGRAAMKGATVSLLGASIAGYVISFLGSVVLAVTSILMTTMGGGSPGWTALICLVGPWVGIKLIQLACVKVLKIGDPFSRRGISSIMKGANIGRNLLNMGQGALTGGIGGFLGGGVGGALRGALGGAMGAIPKSGTMSAIDRARNNARNARNEAAKAATKGKNGKGTGDDKGTSIPNGDGNGTGIPNGDGDDKGTEDGNGTGIPNGDSKGDGNDTGTGIPNGDGDDKGTEDGNGTGIPIGDGKGDGNDTGTGDPNGDGTGIPIGDGKGDGNGKDNGDGTGIPIGDGKGDGTGDPNGDGKSDGDPDDKDPIARIGQLLAQDDKDDERLDGWYDQDGNLHKKGKSDPTELDRIARQIDALNHGDFEAFLATQGLSTDPPTPLPTEGVDPATAEKNAGINRAQANYHHKMLEGQWKKFQGLLGRTKQLRLDDGTTVFPVRRPGVGIVYDETTGRPAFGLAPKPYELEQRRRNRNPNLPIGEQQPLAHALGELPGHTTEIRSIGSRLQGVRRSILNKAHAFKDEVGLKYGRNPTAGDLAFEGLDAAKNFVGRKISDGVYNGLTGMADRMDGLADSADQGVNAVRNAARTAGQAVGDTIYHGMTGTADRMDGGADSIEQGVQAVRNAARTAKAHPGYAMAKTATTIGNLAAAGVVGGINLARDGVYHTRRIWRAMTTEETLEGKEELVKPTAFRIPKLKGPAKPVDVDPSKLDGGKPVYHPLGPDGKRVPRHARSSGGAVNTAERVGRAGKQWRNGTDA